MLHFQGEVAPKNVPQGTDNRAESSAATRVFGGSLVRYDDAVTASNSPGGPQGVTAIRLHVSRVDVRWASPQDVAWVLSPTGCGRGPDHGANWLYSRLRGKWERTT
jgi:hypothetical protein